MFLKGRTMQIIFQILWIDACFYNSSSKLPQNGVETHYIVGIMCTF